jgi:hypothetical protein
MKRAGWLFTTLAATLARTGVAWAQTSDGGDAAGAAIGIAGFCCWGLFMVVLIGLLVLWVWMLIDLIKRPDTDFTGGMSKVVWIVLMIFFSYIAAAIYYFVVYRKLGKAA